MLEAFGFYNRCCDLSLEISVRKVSDQEGDLSSHSYTLHAALSNRVLFPYLTNIEIVGSPHPENARLDRKTLRAVRAHTNLKFDPHTTPFSYAT